jgi:hypothetical protein
VLLFMMILGGIPSCFSYRECNSFVWLHSLPLACRMTPSHP